MAEIARLDLTVRRRSLIGYTAGMALYTLVIVALYPAFKDVTALDDFVKNDSKAAALFGISGSLSTTGGWLNGNIYANFLPLVMLLLTIGYGAASLAGQDEDGTLCLIATLPVRRRRIVLEKAAALVLQALALGAGVAVFVYVGRAFQLDVSAGAAVWTTLAVCLLGIDLGLVAMAVGAFTGGRSTAIAVCTAIAAVSYLISSLAPVVSLLDRVKYVSLFYWSIGDDQVTRGVSAADWAVLAGVGIAGLAVAVRAFRSTDLH